jgi:flagellar hook-associated protein 2
MSSVDGLVSGLSTSSMIKSLMQVEAAPQTRLKNKVSVAEMTVAAYLSVNSKVSAMKGAADNLSQLSTWRAVKPTVSSTSVTATATGGTDTTTGSVKFSVKELASAQAGNMRVSTATEQDPEFPLDPTKTRAVWLDVPDKIYVTVGKLDNGDVIGTPVEIDVSKDKSAKGIQAAINNAGAGVKASLVSVGNDQSVLQLSGTKTGENYAFSFTGLDNASVDGYQIVEQSAATNAVVEVGGGDANPLGGGYTLTSSNNTFTGLMAGVSLTVSKKEDDLTVTSTTNVASMTEKFQALVDAANAALTEVANQTAYDPATKASSPLTGDFNVRQMSQSILSAISQGLSYRKADAPAAPDPKTATPAEIEADADANVVNFGSLSQLGVGLNDKGKLTFNAEKFTAKYNEDPEAIKNAGIAFADTFEALGNKQNTALTGSITGRKNVIDSMNLQIDNWDIRLSARQAALQKQYANLETALGKLNSQSTWLSGQIASLG